MFVHLIFNLLLYLLSGFVAKPQKMTFSEKDFAF
ncbi:Uncharacterised protein [Porphyromonas macacae]|uniref:Uncharacterized protein n=1 Tax=Porphyromonas macacae TaxID=28115 RepID=A0A379E9D7_9PORP|nr:Uncharacterised protein [Porphyromonas macacae]